MLRNQMSVKFLLSLLVFQNFSFFLLTPHAPSMTRPYPFAWHCDLLSLASVLKQQIALSGRLCCTINLSLGQAELQCRGKEIVNCGEIFLFVFY